MVSPRIFRHALVALAVALVSLVATGAAAAKHRQVAIIMDGAPQQTDGSLSQFRALGATTLRVIVFWHDVAPRPESSRAPAHFNASDPGAYPAAGWATYDQIVRDAAAQGMTVDFDIAGGAPRWAQGKGIPPQGRNPSFSWKPSATRYRQFVHAVGERYDGRYRPRGQSSPLPRVSFWALWNEPNFGQDLGPQATHGSTVSVAPMMYRGLVDAGWRALHQTGHGRDTILIGEFAAEGRSLHATRRFPLGLPGDYAQTKPLQFIRTLYCVNGHYRELRGSTARARGCPTTAAGSRRFRRRHPGLFAASGIADHPYSGSRAPNDRKGIDRDFAIFPVLDRLEGALDRANRPYGSRKRYAIYSDEYGYITNPPNNRPGNRYLSPARAAADLNQAEYLSYRSPRVASYAQYLLQDPPDNPKQGLFASGLLTASGAPKATYFAYRMPLYLPRTSVSSRTRTEVWGGARPVHFAGRSAQTVAIQLQPHGRGAYQTVATARAAVSNGYFDARVKLPVSGNVRLQYTYPASEPFLPIGVAGTTIDSRIVRVTVHR